MSAQQKQELIKRQDRYGFNVREAARMKVIGEIGISTELRIEASEMKEQIQALIAA